jgi:hypothetical protein
MDSFQPEILGSTDGNNHEHTNDVSDSSNLADGEANRTKLKQIATRPLKDVTY